MEKESVQQQQQQKFVVHQNHFSSQTKMAQELKTDDHIYQKKSIINQDQVHSQQEIGHPVEVTIGHPVEVAVVFPPNQEVPASAAEEDPRLGYNSSFMTALAQFLQSLLTSSLGFEHLVQISGHMYLSVDDQQTLEYVLDEKICKTELETIFIGNSYCNFPGTQPTENIQEPRFSRVKTEDVTPATDLRVVGVDRSSVVAFMQAVHGYDDNMVQVSKDAQFTVGAHVGVSSEPSQILQEVNVCGTEMNQVAIQESGESSLFQDKDKEFGVCKEEPKEKEALLFKCEQSSNLALKQENPVRSARRKKDKSAVPKAEVIEEETATYYKLKSTRTKTGDILCGDCGKAYSSASALKDHERFVHQGSPRYTCTVCERGFNSRTTYQCHMDAHNNHKSFMCAVCAKAFRYNKGLRDHMVSAHGAEVKVRQKKMLKCSEPDCERVFQSKTLLLAHTNSHQNINSYKCSLCERTFRYNMSLRDHMVRAHQAEGNKCPTCDRVFPNVYEWRRHTQACGKQKRFKCPHCDKKSSYEANMKRHVKDRHRTDGNYKCPKCENISPNLHESNQHKKACGRKDVFNCEQCVKVFWYELNYKKHMIKFHAQLDDKHKKAATVKRKCKKT